MHDSAIGTNWSPNDIVRVLEVDDDGLGGSIGFVIDLAHTDILVGLECLDTLLAFSWHLVVLEELHTQFCHDIDAGYSSC